MYRHRVGYRTVNRLVSVKKAFVKTCITSCYMLFFRPFFDISSSISNTTTIKGFILHFMYGRQERQNVNCSTSIKSFEYIKLVCNSTDSSLTLCTW